MKRPKAGSKFPYPYFPMANWWKAKTGVGEGRVRVGKYTGEYRTPRFGELFISGAEPECYECRTDIIEAKFHIAKPVVIERKVSVTYKEVESG